ncbi:MAG: hypothetical protein A4E58_00472 [Syntrophorhabdus sp. PtaB.Bin006]|nr:MAG: hypothetical protein A4E58_00472 [Syntrophorhabdus sp. PtaB.Bin006]
MLRIFIGTRSGCNELWIIFLGVGRFLGEQRGYNIFGLNDWEARIKGKTLRFQAFFWCAEKMAVFADCRVRLGA